MHIMMRTPFYPSPGGLEAVMRTLAEEFVKAGHRVTIVTPTPSKEPDDFPFAVLRRPSLGQLLRAQQQADVVVLGNISLWWLLALCLCPRPWVATHHGWYCHTGKPRQWPDKLKVWLARFASANISVSHAVNRFLGNPGGVIPNPYDHETFRLLPDVRRDRDLVFLGRLVSDKGADVLIEALSLLKKRGLRPHLTIIGVGPEEAALRQQGSKLGLEEQITFAGLRRGEDLAALLNAHRIMVIPSRWNEPFGVVALEGIACGCGIVCSEGGGLREAAGPCGMTFANGDAQALSEVLQSVLEDRKVQGHLSEGAPAHLAMHHKEEIARAYLEVLARVAA